jgi:hypothetical protein
MKNLILGVVILFLSATCQNEGRWYPDADVSVGNYSEYTDAMGGKHLAVTIIIHNTSKTSITSSTVTIKAATDKREYLQTIGTTNKIIPDGTVAMTLSVDYLEPDEHVQQDGISLYDFFFD